MVCAVGNWPLVRGAESSLCFPVQLPEQCSSQQRQSEEKSSAFCRIQSCV